MESTTETTPDDTIDRWTSTVVLGDGTTALIRPIRPDDAPALQAFHERQSQESRYRRFFSPKPTLGDTQLERFTVVDYIDRFAFVVEDHGEFIAWASYERLKNRSDAEVAFMVDDRHHGRGIATLMLEHLAAAAKTNGIERFTAQTLGDNRAMLAVFSKAGWPVHRRFESGVIDIDFPLADTSEFIDSVERREQRADSRAVARLLLPTSIAVIGASDAVGSVGHAAWQSVSSRSTRPAYPVSRHHPTIGGRIAYPTVVDVPDEVELAIIAVPTTALAATIDECVAKRVRGAVVITTATDVDLDVEALVTRARRNGLRIIGPGSFGIASPRPEIEIQAALVDISLPPGRVAVSMQSGTLATSLLRLAETIQLGLSWFVSLGDKRDVSANDLLQFWEDDEATSVIAIYTESLGNAQKFARIAKRVSATKPIVSVRTGAALLDTANGALYEQTGVIEVPTVTAMLDTARVLESQPLMNGFRVGVVSNSTSPTVLATATLGSAGLEVVDTPQLDWRSTSEHYADAIRSALDDDGVDAVLVIHAPPTFDAIDDRRRTVEDAGRAATKPIVAVMLGTHDGPLTTGSPIPNFAFPEQAAAALGRLAAYAAWRRADAEERAESEAQHDRPDASANSHIDPVRAGALIAEHLDDATMEPRALRRLLASYGVIMASTLVVDGRDAVEAAHEIGYPVAIKATERRIGRSVEAGIALDLSDDTDVIEAVGLMQQHLGERAQRVHVQQMVPPGVDLRIRATRDPRLGPLITVGIGGVQADAIGDETSRLAPVSPTTARALVSATRAATLLDEHALDLVADEISRVAQLVSDHDEIVDLDLNPVIVSDERCWVVDGTIELGPPDRTRPSVRRLG